ncbi:hypothetical protein EDD16DRAFT_1492265 [Pisolithus croceorrhizus]|nr:hypothetical protein EDD16DRAFT_1492265 [Pisolithus croceorrhizus]KAI6156036.1 hypothetical protein EDD17DRAFT_1068198 [Pisolithus thermaeus]
MGGSRDLNVLVMGEVGSGKSSVVNLLVGKEVAKVSSDAGACTLRTVKHETTIQVQETWTTVHIWEVAGLNQPEEVAANDSGTTLDMDLGPILKAKASIDIILFCMQSSRLKNAPKQIFESVNKVFGRCVAIVLVITNLEREKENMENWWDRNGERVRRVLGLGETEHACITGLQDAKYEAKSTESRTSLVSILEGRCSSHQDSVSLESVLKDHVRQNGGYHKKSYAMKRFKLDAATAKRLV